MKTNKKKRKKEVFIKTETLFFPNLGEDQKKGLHQKSNTFFHQTQVKNKKKRSSPKIEHFFSRNSSGHLRSDAHQSQIIGGMQM